MKKIVVIICLVLSAMQAMAQDPDFSGGVLQSSHSIPPDLLEIGEHVTAELYLTNIGGDMTFPAPQPGGPAVFRVVTTNIGMPTITFLDGGGNYFTTQINALADGQYEIILTQIAAISELDYSHFQVVGITEKTLMDPNGKYYAGYLGSMNAGGYTDTNTGQDNPASSGEIGTVLPVTLVSFKAVKEGKVSQLNWATTEETNSDRFEVERSGNGKSWIKIGTVKSSGESKVLKSYAFADLQPKNGENLYRLKMIDKDATFAYSRIASVQFEGLAGQSADVKLSVYPNPTTDKLFLQDMDLSQIARVSIIDLNGHAVYSSSSYIQTNGIPVSKLSAGVYILHVTNQDGSSRNSKFLIGR